MNQQRPLPLHKPKRDINRLSWLNQASELHYTKIYPTSFTEEVELREVEASSSTLHKAYCTGHTSHEVSFEDHLRCLLQP